MHREGDSMYLFQRIEEVMMQYNDARRSIGEFVLHERENLHHYSMQEIADMTYTSKATLVRFAKTLGYKGWKEFMQALTVEEIYQDAHPSYIDVNYPFHEGDKTKEIMHNISNLQIESIKDTLDLMDPEMVDKAADILIHARQVIIFGLRPNSIVADLFRRKMMTLGRKTELAHMGEAGIISSMMSKEDCAIIISYSGNNEETYPVNYVSMFLKQNIPMIGITSDGENYLRSNLDCVLTMSSRERLYTKIANFATEESLQFILNVLFSTYFARNYQTHCQFKIQHAKQLETDRIATLNVIKEQEDEA